MKKSKITGFKGLKPTPWLSKFEFSLDRITLDTSIPSPQHYHESYSHFTNSA